MHKVTDTKPVNNICTVTYDRLAPIQAVQEALQAGDITSEQADAARQRYAAIHRHFVLAMAKEKELLDEAKLLNEELLVSAHIAPFYIPNEAGSLSPSDAQYL